jgi:hypothetical protein
MESSTASSVTSFLSIGDVVELGTLLSARFSTGAVLWGAGRKCYSLIPDLANWAPASEAQVKSVTVCPGTQPFPPAPQRICCQRGKKDHCFWRLEPAKRH